MDAATRNTNPAIVPLDELPVMAYDAFFTTCRSLLQQEQNHCLAYFGMPTGVKYWFICLIGDDINHTIHLLSYELSTEAPRQLQSLSLDIPAMQLFEREISERYGIEFTGHPWPKPLRYAHNRFDKLQTPATYPFYSIASEELHEVGVGPVHAGIIEPGHFRFICNGENILHLEIQLGYQHRGMEELFVQKGGILQQAVLAEQIAGDTTIGHALAYAGLAEMLAGVTVPIPLQLIRTMALEMERIAIHIGDTAALCTDIAYQLGQVTLEPLRTQVINTLLHWCGNRFGKGFVRPAGSYYYPDKQTLDLIRDNLSDVLDRFLQVADRIYTSPGVLARFEDCGRLTGDQVSRIGAVGMAARMAGMNRDIRISHPFMAYRNDTIPSHTLESGDVLARGLLRREEVIESIHYVLKLIEKYREVPAGQSLPGPDNRLPFGKNMLAVSLVEGWRGEICHTAVTGEKGEIVHYKIKDPSFHNWLALALAVREEEISNFPVNNKSFNLSYCGFDL
jgi:Ni,Fe-hydrogenase III large subunit